MDRGYISADKKGDIVKREIRPGVFRDVFKIRCEECEKEFLHNISFTIKCPNCELETKLLK